MISISNYREICANSMSRVPENQSKNTLVLAAMGKLGQAFSTIVRKVFLLNAPISRLLLTSPGACVEVSLFFLSDFSRRGLACVR